MIPDRLLRRSIIAGFSSVHVAKNAPTNILGGIHLATLKPERYNFIKWNSAQSNLAAAKAEQTRMSRTL